MRGSADGIEHLEILGVTISRSDRGFDALLNFFGLALKHGRLIGDANAGEVHIRIEAGRHRVSEGFKEVFKIPLALNVAANVIGVRKGEDDQIVTVSIFAHSAGGCGSCFLVPCLAVNDAGDAVFGIGANPTPDFHHITACGIDDVAALGINFIHEGRGRAECGNDDHIIGRQVIVVATQFLPRQRDDAHVDELTVDLGVMNDFANEKNTIIGKHLARGVGEINGALDAVAKAEFLSESQGRIADYQFAMKIAQALDDGRFVMLRHFRSDQLHHIRATNIDSGTFDGSFSWLWHGKGDVTENGEITNQENRYVVVGRRVISPFGRKCGLLPHNVIFFHVALVFSDFSAMPLPAMATVGSLNIPQQGFSAVIFDCDGTLVDTMPAHFEAWCEALAQFGAANVLAEDVFYAMGGRPTKDIVMDLNAEYGLKLDPARVALTKREAFLRKLHACELIEEVADFARSMRGKVPMGIATGGSRFVIEKTLQIVGVSDWFDEVITADDVSNGKPAPDIYLEAARRLGISPSKCLAFEDAPAGIDSARAAGMMIVEIPCPTRA